MRWAGGWPVTWAPRTNSRSTSTGRCRDAGGGPTTAPAVEYWFVPDGQAVPPELLAPEPLALPDAVTGAAPGQGDGDGDGAAGGEGSNTQVGIALTPNNDQVWANLLPEQ